MAGVRITLDRVGLFKLLRSPTGVVGRDAFRRGLRVRNVARRLAPVDTGRLKNSIQVEMKRGIRGLKVDVGTSLKYAKFQHDGTGIHGNRGRPIRRRRGKVMVFTWRGERVFARQVRGVPATKFLERALLAAL